MWITELLYSSISLQVPLQRRNAQPCVRGWAELNHCPCPRGLNFCLLLQSELYRKSYTETFLIWQSLENRAEHIISTSVSDLIVRIIFPFAQKAPWQPLTLAVTSSTLLLDSLVKLQQNCLTVQHESHYRVGAQQQWIVPTALGNATYFCSNSLQRSSGKPQNQNMCCSCSGHLFTVNSLPFASGWSKLVLVHFPVHFLGAWLFLTRMNFFYVKGQKQGTTFDSAVAPLASL